MAAVAPSWLVAGTAAEGGEGERTAKRKKGGEGEGEAGKGGDEVIRSLAKLSLSNAQQLREQAAACMRTVLVSSDGAVAKAVLAAGRNYHEEAQKNPRHEMGPPQVHQCLAAVRARMSLPGMTVFAELRRWWDEVLTKTGPKELGLIIRVFRLKKCFSDAKKKLLFSMDGPGESLLLQALARGGGEVRVGSAPAGELEETLQRFLDK